MKYSDLLVKKKVDNGDYPATKDYISLESVDDYKDRGLNYSRTKATDFAIFNGADVKLSDDGNLYGPVYTRTDDDQVFSGCNIFYISNEGVKESGFTIDEHMGIRPQISIDISRYLKAREVDSSRMNIYQRVGGKPTISLGKYPNHVADDQEEIDDLFNQGKLKALGRSYLSEYGDHNSLYYPEYTTEDGRRYVRCPIGNARHNGDPFMRFNNGTHIEDYKDREDLWFEVEYIPWVIKNWDELPKSINPDGTGKAKTMDLYSVNMIRSGLPFYPSILAAYGNVWQNSTIRGYLNGYNMTYLNGVKGGKPYQETDGGDFFPMGGFLCEAMMHSISPELDNLHFADESEDTSQDIKEYITNKKSRLAQLNPDDTKEKDRRQMTDKELIQSWVDAGRSVLLRGPSGIGKTEKLKELYPDLIYLKLTNNMFPEKVVGSMNLQTGQSIPPDFAKQAILACATDEEKALVEKNVQNLYKIADEVYERSKTAEGKLVIMLDELLNVKPAVQSLVYTLVLNKIVENGNGMKLPANTVIVATGNQKKYSSVAEDLAEPLEKRFDHIYDMQPKVGEWIYEYAIPNNIHPSVVSYVLNKYMCQDKSEEISDMGYFYEEPEIGEEKLDQYGCKGRTNDPRGWTSISNMLYSFEDNLTKGKYKGKDVEHILDTSLKSKLREEWAADFMDFYNNPTISVEDVVAGNYTEEDLPQDINERFAYVSGLIGADEKQLPKVRDFIRKYCDPEYVELYDITWVGKSEERAEQLAEVKSWQDAEWKEEHAAEKDVIEEKTEEHVGDKKPSEEWYKLQKTIKELGDFLVDNDELYKY